MARCTIKGPLDVMLLTTHTHTPCAKQKPAHFLPPETGDGAGMQHWRMASAFSSTLCTFHQYNFAILQCLTVAGNLFAKAQIYASQTQTKQFVKIATSPIRRCAISGHITTESGWINRVTQIHLTSCAHYNMKVTPCGYERPGSGFSACRVKLPPPHCATLHSFTANMQKSSLFSK